MRVEIDNTPYVPPAEHRRSECEQKTFHVRVPNRLSLHWAPAVAMAGTVLLQITVWDAPPSLRWDGTLSEWPIPWMVCCGSITNFFLILAAYGSAWVTTIAVGLFQSRVSVCNLVLLFAFPVLVYCFMYWYYFA